MLKICNAEKLLLFIMYIIENNLYLQSDKI